MSARIVAVADVIRENLDKTRVKFNVDDARAYYGPDAFRELAASKVDGVVIEGASAVDQAPVTGESIPVDKAAGDGSAVDSSRVDMIAAGQPP